MAKNTNPKPGSGPQQTSELANVPHGSQLATNSSMPAWLKRKMEGQAPRGLELADKNDLIYPRLVLCQALSEACKGGPAAIARPGQVIDNLTSQLILEYGDELEFIPVIMSKQRIYSKPIAEGGGILCRSDDAIKARPGGKGQDQGGMPTAICANCIMKEWDDSRGGAGGGKPLCTNFIQIVGLLPQHGYRPMVWSCSKTSLTVGKRMLSIAKQVDADFWAMKFLLRVVDDKAGAFDFYNWDFSQPENPWSNEEEYDRGLNMFKALKGKTWTVAEDAVSAEEAAPAQTVDSVSQPTPTGKAF